MKSSAAVVRNRARQRGRSPPSAVSRTRSTYVARRVGAIVGYRCLNNSLLGRVKQRGPAFFTKWLYTATARGVHDHEIAAPVLDNRVFTWINEKTDMRLATGTPTTTPRTSLR
ncbi:hypothetical protein [Cellulosimicrobium cellulans]|uniref:8-oxoguanine DNA glycosylase OGG fold protein n=1 Tax=Cellulosimicrobium cellulans TaxID=1710 RepID=UPI0039F1E20F